MYIYDILPFFSADRALILLYKKLVNKCLTFLYGFLMVRNLDAPCPMKDNISISFASSLCGYVYVKENDSHVYYR